MFPGISWLRSFGFWLVFRKWKAQAGDWIAGEREEKGISPPLFTSSSTASSNCTFSLTVNKAGEKNLNSGSPSQLPRNLLIWHVNDQYICIFSSQILKIQPQGFNIKKKKKTTRNKWTDMKFQVTEYTMMRQMKDYEITSSNIPPF